MSEQLAIHGGQPTIPEGTIKPWPHITDADRQAVMEVLSSDSINEQRKIQSEALSQEWAAYVDRKYCIPTNSGTAALHMCIAALGIEPGDEVIVPAFTFWATAAAVLHHNAIPIFVDIDPKTFCIDPAQIEAKLSERTKAVVAVHIHGMPADMDGVLAIARQHELKVIEDAAQAHGSRYKGVPCGAIGDVAGFSTQMSKTLTTGSEGGLFVTDDEDYHKQAALLQYFGELVVPGRERQEQEYNAFGLGWMYRGDVFGQAFIRSQLKRLDTNNALRIRNCNFLTEHLSKIKGIETPYVPPHCESVFYNYVVGVKPDELGAFRLTESFPRKGSRSVSRRRIARRTVAKETRTSAGNLSSPDRLRKRMPMDLRSCPASRISDRGLSQRYRVHRFPFLPFRREPSE